MKKFFYILVTFTILSSCSEYQKALKSEDIATKFNNTFGEVFKLPEPIKKNRSK